MMILQKQDITLKRFFNNLFEINNFIEMASFKLLTGL